MIKHYYVAPHSLSPGTDLPHSPHLKTPYCRKRLSSSKNAPIGRWFEPAIMTHFNVYNGGSKAGSNATKYKSAKY